MAETKPEIKNSGGWNLDGIAAKLQAKADEVLKSTGTDEDAAEAGGKREALRNVANIVKENAGKGLESSKEYLSKVVEQVSGYATSTTGSAQFADLKEKGISHMNIASESANAHYAKLKDSASTHLGGVQSNLNKAIAQGQGQARATSTDSENTDRALPTEEEPLSFPFNLVAWFVALCHGKGSSTTSSTSESTTSTSKDFSIESLHNTAAMLTDTLAQGVRSAGKPAQDAKETTVADTSENVEAAKSSDSGSIKEEVHNA